MKNLSLVAATAAMMIAASAGATDYYAKSDITDWTTASNFMVIDANGEFVDSTVVPGAAEENVDEVHVTNNWTVTIQDAASLACVNRLKRIRPSQESKVVFVVPQGETWTNLCQINFDGVNRTAFAGYGKVYKRGEGDLELVSRGDYFQGGYNTDFCTSFFVEEGMLILPQTSPNQKVFYNYLYNVSEGAALALHHPKETYPCYISGAGLITNLDNSANVLLFLCGSSLTYEFSGRIDGNISLVNASGTAFTGTNSHFTGYVKTFNGKANEYATGNGFTRVRKFGKIGKPSSIGSGTYFALGTSTISGSGYLSLREADDPIDECDKGIGVGCYPGYPTYLDAGANGGLLFTGKIQHPIDSSKTYTYGNVNLELFGSNTVDAAVIKGDVASQNYQGENYFFHLTQKGGFWRLADGNPVQNGTTKLNIDNGGRMGLSGITVEKGLMQIDSYARQHDLCCLGIGTNFMEGVTGYTATPVEWQVALGSANGEGALEYVGTNDVEGSTRPLVFRGDAKLLNSTESAQVRFVALAPETTKASTLTLGGSNTRDNEISDLTDTAEHPLSIVKEGAGKWVLGGNQTYHGNVHVKGGELVVKTYEQRYKWYKWLIKEATTTAAATAQDSILQAHFFGLYDQEGKCRSMNLDVIPNYASLQPGQAAYGTSHHITERSDGSGALVQLFLDGNEWTNPNTGLKHRFGWYANYYDALGNVSKPRAPESPWTWMPIVMRLRNEQRSDIVRWDFVNYYGTQSGDKAGSNRHVHRYRIEGSVDGLHWDTLTGDDDKIINEEDMPTANNCWVSGGKSNYSFSQSGSYKNGENHTYGTDKTSVPANNDFELSKQFPYAEDMFSVWNNVGSVQVDAGATLSAAFEGEKPSISKLTVASTGGSGTISGFDFAEGGTLDVVGTQKPSGAIQGPTVTGTTSLDNVASWTLTRNGVADSRRVIKVDNGQILIESVGLILILQ